MFLCRKCTGEKLKNIGIHFWIGESGVSQGSRRVANKIKEGLGRGGNAGRQAPPAQIRT